MASEIVKHKRIKSQGIAQGDGALSGKISGFINSEALQSKHTKSVHEIFCRLLQKIRAGKH